MGIHACFSARAAKGHPFLDNDITSTSASAMALGPEQSLTPISNQERPSLNPAVSQPPACFWPEAGIHQEA
jgi:hypothetical protein